VSIHDLEPGDRVHVQAHGEIRADFDGVITRIDVDNYLVFVKKPHGRRIWGASPAFIS
jgi:hypothetical protein